MGVLTEQQYNQLRDTALAGGSGSADAWKQLSGNTVQYDNSKPSAPVGSTNGTQSNYTSYNTSSNYQPATSYTGAQQVIGNTQNAIGSKDGLSDYQGMYDGLRATTGQNQVNTWQDNKGNVYNTSGMTPQQIHALSLFKDNNSNAAAILKGMGLDMNGNPLQEIRTTIAPENYQAYIQGKMSLADASKPSVSTSINNKINTLSNGSSGGGTTTASSGATSSATSTSTPTTSSGRYNPDASAQDRLAEFARNPQAASQEIAIVKAMYEAEKKNGASQARLDEIHNWANQVRGVSGIADDNVVASSGGSVGGSSFMQAIQNLLGQSKASQDESKAKESKSRDDAMKFIEQMVKGNLDSTKAGLTANKDSSMTALLKAYGDAIGSQATGIRDADTALAGQNAQIAQQAYENSQARNATGVQRGIGNSQQFLGMQETDAQLANQANNAALGDRNNKVYALQQRISQLTTQRDLDTANINNQYNSAITSATSDAGAKLAQAYFDNAQAGIASQSASDAAFSNNAFQAILAGLTTEQQQSFQTELAKMQQGFARENMFTQADIQSTLMDKGFVQDMQKLATQNGYAKELQQASANAQVAVAKIQQAGKLEEFKAELAAKNESDEKAYQLARERELAKYTPGTDEYKIRSSQLEDARSSNKQAIFDKAANDIYVKQVLSDENFTSTQPTPYNNPVVNIANGGGSWRDYLNFAGTKLGELFFGDSVNEKQAKSDAQQRAYKNYADLLSGNLK